MRIKNVLHFETVGVLDSEFKLHEKINSSAMKPTPLSSQGITPVADVSI
jgi:hypothetical protein